MSIKRLLALDPDVRLYVGHDYPPAGKSPSDRCYSTVAEQRASNIHLRLKGGARESNSGEEPFVLWRAQRDATLGAPRLLHPSLQVNIRGGMLPEPDKDGRIFFKTPVAVKALS
jgi:glyoxylase-like metal-dependent hydrolase (beta-lactamase superfamily II)